MRLGHFWCRPESKHFPPKNYKLFLYSQINLVVIYFQFCYDGGGLTVVVVGVVGAGAGFEAMHSPQPKPPQAKDMIMYTTN
jgi:hypothetical protein